jgi:hypothetical protein
MENQRGEQRIEHSAKHSTQRHGQIEIGQPTDRWPIGCKLAMAHH